MQMRTQPGGEVGFGKAAIDEGVIPGEPVSEAGGQYRQIGREIAISEQLLRASVDSSNPASCGPLPPPCSAQAIAEIKAIRSK